MYNANGSNYVDPISGLTMDEFRVNITTFGNQTTPAVAMDANGDFVAAWVGPDPTAPQTIPPTPANLTAIYTRIMVLDPNTYLPYIAEVSRRTRSPISDERLLRPYPTYLR